MRYKSFILSNHELKCFSGRTTPQKRFRHQPILFYKYFRIIILFPVLLLSAVLYAQQYADKNYYLVDSIVLENLLDGDLSLLDSALTKYHETGEDTLKFKALFLITQQMANEVWIEYNKLLYNELQEYLKNLTISEKETLFAKRMLANVLGDFGFYAASVQSDFNTALAYFHEALALSEELDDKYNMVTMLNNIGSVLERFGDISGALESYQKSLMICEETGYKKGMPSLLNNIGLINMTQGNYPEAIDYLGRSLQMHEELNEHKNVARNLENIGLTYSLMGNPEKAMTYLLKSLDTAEAIGDKTIIGRALKSIAGEYLKQGDLSNSEKYGKRALTLFENLGNKRGVASVYLLFGEIALKRNDLRKASHYADQSLKYTQELGFPDDIRNAALLSSNIYQKKKEYKNGLNMYKLYISMRDSILNISTRESTIAQQTLYKVEKARILKIQEQREATRKAMELRKRRYNFQYAIIFIVLLCLSVGVALLGKIRLGPRATQAFIYFAILILFESTLVIADPYVENLVNGEPGWKLMANVGIALLLFPFHTVLDRKLKKRILKK